MAGLGEMADWVGLPSTRNPLKDAFLRWQCRVRQIAMRERQGRPDDAIMPALTLPGETAPLGHVVTVLSKAPSFSKTPELMHMVKRTHDPAQRREKAIELFSETYFQKPKEFSDVLTAAFGPNSEAAERIAAAGGCTLTFEAYSQGFDLKCEARKLGRNDPMYQATWWHNLLFNPNLHPETDVLAFRPDWDKSTSS